MMTLAGCAGFSNGRVAELVTDLPQLVSYAEHFNSVSESYKLSVRYNETPWATVIEESRSADLVAGIGLNSLPVVRAFSELGDIFDEVPPESFYEELLRLGVQAEKQLVLPLSFEIPMLIMRSSDSDVLSDGSTIDIDELRSLSEAFTASGENRIGFSPRWFPEAAYLFTRFFDVGFHQTEEALVAWNDSLLRSAVRYLATWSIELNGGAAAEELFRSKYMYDPPYKLIAERRIRFAPTDMRTFLTVPAEIGEQIEFRWLVRDGTINVDEDITFIGRLKTSRNKRAADAFLRWLFAPQTQDQLLEVDRHRRVRGFGFAGGFSSLKSVNSDSLPRYYSFLLGRIPAESDLRFPARLPANWPDIRINVIYPWLVEQSGIEETTTPLNTQLQQWRRQQPDSP